MPAFRTQMSREQARLAAKRMRPGPQGLPREQVSEVQRMRLLRAMAEIAAPSGLQPASVAQVVGRAGVSRRTFYDLFADREDCFLAVFDEAVTRATERIRAAVSLAGGRWVERVRTGLYALLCCFEEEPELARVCVVWALGASPAILARRGEVLGRLAAVIDEGRAAPRAKDPPPLSAEGAIGAVFAVIHARLLEPKPAPLRELQGELMGLIVLPYLGPGAVAAERARAAPPAIGPARASWSSAKDPLEGLDMRITYRTLRVLGAVAQHPGGSNREIASAAGITDQGQISKLLNRFETLGLAQNRGEGHIRGAANAWSLTRRGKEVEQATRQASESAAGGG